MSQNLSQGLIQVFGNSPSEINRAIRQVIDRIDAVQGLRGSATVYDRLGVSTPTSDDDASTKAYVDAKTAGTFSNLTITGYLKHTGTTAGFFGHALVSQRTVDAVTNNVTSGGSSGVIANYNDLAVYANDAAAIRNDLYQLARSLQQVTDALRTLGLGA